MTPRSLFRLTCFLKPKLSAVVVVVGDDGDDEDTEAEEELLVEVGELV